MISKGKININDDFIYIILAITTVFLLILKFMFFSTIFLLVLAAFIIAKKKEKTKFLSILFILSSFIFLILIQTIIDPSPYFGMEFALKEVSRLIIYILIIFIVSNIKVRERTFFYLWRAIFISLLTIAIFQYYKLFNINEVIGNIYGETIHLAVSAKYDNLSSFRAGSVFLNFNNYAKFIVAIFGLYLCTKIGWLRQRSMYFIFGISILLALVLAGSRTGFVILIILILYKIGSEHINKGIRYKRTNIVKASWALTVIVILVFLNSIYQFIDFDVLRLFKVSQGLDNSLNYKIITLLNILSEFRPINVFIGLGTFDTHQWGITTLDTDLGYLVAFYGFIGVILFSLLIYNLHTFRRGLLSPLSNLNNYLIIVILLFGLTAGMFFNIRIFSILLLLAHTNLIKGSEE